jgi:hypothetical protein
MIFKKRYPCTYAMALVLMPVYLFIAALHLFFIPRFQESPGAADRIAYKTDTQLVYYLVRNDKSTLTESKNTKTIQKKKPHWGAAVLTNISPCLNALKYNSFISQFPHDYHHSWLSNRVLRI